MYNHVQVNFHAILALFNAIEDTFCFIIYLSPFAGLMPFNAG